MCLEAMIIFSSLTSFNFSFAFLDWGGTMTWKHRSWRTAGSSLSQMPVMQILNLVSQFTIIRGGTETQKAGNQLELS